MILDTNAVSALLAGDALILPVLDQGLVHHLPSIVIGEYRYGLARSTLRTVIEPLFEDLIQECSVLTVGAGTAIAYAEVRNQLRRDGMPIPENDVWICALAIEHGLPIVTRDKHFSHASGVSVVHW